MTTLNGAKQAPVTSRPKAKISATTKRYQFRLSVTDDLENALGEFLDRLSRSEYRAFVLRAFCNQRLLDEGVIRAGSQSKSWTARKLSKSQLEGIESPGGEAETLAPVDEQAEEQASAATKAETKGVSTDAPPPIDGETQKSLKALGSMFD